MNLPERVFLWRPYEELPDLDAMNLWELKERYDLVGEVSWFTEPGELPADFDYRTDIAVTDLSRRPLVFGELGLRFQEVLPTYPEVLKSFMGDRVLETGTVYQALERAEREGPLFIKPYGFGNKMYTGQVVHGLDDGMALMHVLEVESHICRVVDFVAEWRFFVANGTVVGSRRYRGDPLALFDPKAVLQAVSEVESWYGTVLGGYSLDFGRTRDGKFLLVEANPGYALGGYEVEPDVLLTVYWAWWQKRVTPIGGR